MPVGSASLADQCTCYAAKCNYAQFNCTTRARCTEVHRACRRAAAAMWWKCLCYHRQARSSINVLHNAGTAL